MEEISVREVERRRQVEDRSTRAKAQWDGNKVEIQKVRDYLNTVVIKRWRRRVFKVIARFRCGKQERGDVRRRKEA